MADNIPIIRIELERMKQTLMVAINDQLAVMDVAVRLAIEAVCDEENIKRIIAQQAQQTLTEAVRREIEHFLWTGDKGRSILRAGIEKVFAAMKGDSDGN